MSLQNYSELSKNGTVSEKELEDTNEILGKLENIIGDCIAKVNARLKSSRIDAVKQMRRSSERKKLGYLTQLEIMRN